MNSEKNMPSSIVDAQVQRLLEIVNDYQKEQCDVLLEEAHKQSRKIIRQAYRNARLRLHRDIQESRQNMQQELSATRAKQHTFMMQQKHRQDQEFLDQAWKMLKEELLERWRNPQQRQLWVQNIIVAALKMLPGQSWQVAHPSDWSSVEQNDFRKSVESISDREISFNRDDNIVAGIRVSADAALVDGTVQGLMADRIRIESEMLSQRRDILMRNQKASQQ